MQKQLSKKSHKPTQSSIDDFMKHIRKYNLQSERYISPKPLLYMYTNPSRHHTLQTLQKSRSKSKTLSNRQGSTSKKALSKNIREKVQKMLSITKKYNFHRKSLSTMTNKNQKSIKKLNRSTAEMDLMKSKQKLKSKLHQFQLKPKSTCGKITKKSKANYQQYQPKYTQRSPTIPPQLSSSIQPSRIQQNPAQLIQTYSQKLHKVQLFLESSKHKTGSLLCKKFQQILNQIIESLVDNLKKSLNELQVDIQKRLAKHFQKQFDRAMNKKEEEIRAMQRMCEKMTGKITEMIKKQNYANTLIYSLRLKGIDIDNEFGKAVWGIDDLGGMGYSNHAGIDRDMDQNSQQQKMSLGQVHEKKLNKQINKNNQGQKSSSSGEFQFCQHPNMRQKQQIKQSCSKQMQLSSQQQKNNKNRFGQINRDKYIVQQDEQVQFTQRQQQYIDHMILSGANQKRKSR